MSVGVVQRRLEPGALAANSLAGIDQKWPRFGFVAVIGCRCRGRGGDARKRSSLLAPAISREARCREIPLR